MVIYYNILQYITIYYNILHEYAYCFRRVHRMRAKKFGLGTSRRESRSKTRKLGCGLWNETRRLLRRLGNSQPNANLEDFIRAS